MKFRIVSVVIFIGIFAACEGGTTTKPGTLAEQAALAVLASNGFDFPGGLECKGEGCVSLRGIREETINGAVALKKASGAQNLMVMGRGEDSEKDTLEVSPVWEDGGVFSSFVKQKIEEGLEWGSFNDNPHTSYSIMIDQPYRYSVAYSESSTRWVISVSPL